MLGAIRPTGSGGGGAVASVFGRSGAVVAASNDYSASQIAGLGGGAGALVVTPSATQTLTAASSIAANAGTVAITAASPITLASNPQVSAGGNGQRVAIVNTGTNAITLVNGNGLILGQNYVLYGGKSIVLIYLDTYSSWIIEGLIPESVALTGVPTAPTAAWNANSTQIATTAQVFNALYNHDAPGWRSLTLTSNWANFGSGFPGAAIKRVGRDLVFLRGVLAVSGSYGAAIATIPTDCRPSVPTNLVTFCTAGACQITITPAGSLESTVSMAVGSFQTIGAAYCL